jgi:hypothetical protein
MTSNTKPIPTVAAKLGDVQATPNAHGKERPGKSNTAELRDGPEGEQVPLANLVRGYARDDQIETALGLAPGRFASTA